MCRWFYRGYRHRPLERTRAVGRPPEVQRKNKPLRALERTTGRAVEESFGFEIVDTDELPNLDMNNSTSLRGELIHSY